LDCVFYRKLGTGHPLVPRWRQNIGRWLGVNTFVDIWLRHGSAIYIKTKMFHGVVCPVTGQATCFLCRRRSPGDFYKGSEGVSAKTRYPSMAISRTASTMVENSMRSAFQLGSIARTKRSSNLYHMKRYSFGRGQRCFFSSQACAEHLPPRPGRRVFGR
jgi:hypothetical protein